MDKVQQLFEEYLKIHKRYYQVSTNAFVPINISLTQWNVLKYIHFNQDKLTVSDLANKAEVRVPTMTETVKHLLDEKILEAETDAQDKRKKYYHLTPSGEQLFEQANDIGLTVQNDLLQDCTEEEIDTTIKVLNSISQRLTHY